MRTEEIAKEITKRCQIIKALRKYRIPEKQFRQACIAFIGGKFNYVTPWLAAELKIKQTYKPIEIAYNEYMRTYIGCIKTTSIAVLHAISRFPLLRDKIKTDCALTLIKAKAQGNLLGEDFGNWNGSVPEWTPFGCVSSILRRESVTLPAAIHSQVIIKSSILEQISKCKFSLGGRKSALECHKTGKLIPPSPDIAIWTDGSLNRENEDEELDSGAAAIVKITNPPDSVEIHDTIQSQIRITNAASSYETEMIAIQTGLDVVKAEKPRGRKIHLFTDSLSCLQQLACLPYKLKYVHEIVADVAESLAELVQVNEVELHFIPSHTGNIPESDEIDALAKAAATEGREIEHDPFISTFKLEFRKLERRLLEGYLWKTIKPSQYAGYPDRIPIRNGYITIKSGKDYIKWPLSSSNALLN